MAEWQNMSEEERVAAKAAKKAEWDSMTEEERDA